MINMKYLKILWIVLIVCTIAQQSRAIQNSGDMNDLRIEGSLNKKDTKSISNKEFYTPGDNITYSCILTSPLCYYCRIVWTLSKDNTDIFVAGPLFGNNLTIDMTILGLYDGSILSCKKTKNGTAVKALDVHLHVDNDHNDTSIVQSTHVYKKQGEDFNANDMCDSKVAHVRQFNASNHFINRDPVNIRVESKNNNDKFICLLSNSKQNEEFIEMRVTKLIILYVDGDDTANSTNKQETGASNSTIIIIICSVLLIIIPVLIIYFHIKRRRNRKHGETAVSAVEPEYIQIQVPSNAKPTPATSGEIVYAELQLAHDARLHRNPTEESPYAEIIGVLGPKRK